ncbi:hypothetical protein A7P61_07215 [Pantoea agglomerans pv. betae]|uniref:hypothetical protein n=1 Tax=Enterobacter agglomerans TaxID=549 RepID=UPI000ACD95F1|nr:hypothetical protein [Pantoea agglomerans]WHU84777.1 hypothetical protein A7P61_07215 [Pantoea agglomerans pv. betae]
MRRFTLNGALFMFMERGEKLTDDAIWNDRWGPGDRYVIWPRGVYWDVKFKKVEQGKLEWLPISDKPFASSDEAWQAAYADWEQKMLCNYKR